jgi:ribosomal-protein-alanine N-acetyltransferase
MATVAVRPGVEADYAALADIACAAYESNFEELEPGGMETEGYREKVRAMFTEEIPTYGKGLRVAEIGDRLAGWGARFHGKNYVMDLWVDPHFQGQGAGTAILQALFADMRADGHRTAEIDTHERNAGAIRLYERMGFVIVDRFMRWSKGLKRDIPHVLMRAALA